MAIYHIGWIKRGDSVVSADSEQSAKTLAIAGHDKEFEEFTTYPPNNSPNSTGWFIESIEVRT